MSRTPRVAVVGLPFFAERAARALRGAGLDARYAARPGRSVRDLGGSFATLARADAIYAIGSDVARNSRLDLLARLRKPILVHWVGSDVLHATKVGAEGRLSARLVRGARHLADAPWLVDELRPLGVRATSLPLPIPVAIGALLPLPTEFRVLMYVARPEHTAYDAAGMLQCVEALPGVRFMAVGAYTPPAVPPNLEVLGYVPDMPSVYARTSIFLRLMHHDGLAHSVIEALSFGRHVIWSYPWPGVTTATTPAAAIEAIADMAARHEHGTLSPNVAGEALVREQFEPGRLVEQVRAELQALLS